MNLLLTTPRTSRWGRCLLRAALVLWSQILGPSALAQDRPIEGTILVLIADRRDGRSAIEYMLLQPDGRTTRLTRGSGSRLWIPAASTGCGQPCGAVRQVPRPPRRRRLRYHPWPLPRAPCYRLRPWL
jgi:hypothetical protein